MGALGTLTTPLHPRSGPVLLCPLRSSNPPSVSPPSVPEANGLPEPVLPKRLRGTPERIELENYQLSLQREEVLEEVPEETLAEHNLSSVLDKTLNADPGSRWGLNHWSNSNRCRTVIERHLQIAKVSNNKREAFFLGGDLLLLVTGDL